MGQRAEPEGEGGKLALCVNFVERYCNLACEGAKWKSVLIELFSLSPSRNPALYTKQELGVRHCQMPSGIINFVLFIFRNNLCKLSKKKKLKKIIKKNL